jgi:uncharacterized glyoxalase superfamily protein PhnB
LPTFNTLWPAALRPNKALQTDEGNLSCLCMRKSHAGKPDLYDKRKGGVWSVYLQVHGVRELFMALSQLPGVTILEPLCHQPYGQTEFVIRDPNGYALVFAERD